MKSEEIKRFVKKRYGEIAKSEHSCCCSPTIEIDTLKELGYSQRELESIPKEAFSLGCGNPVALASLEEGEIVLDLGSGAGLDCFLAASKVGKKGKVIGVDMTPEMIDKAKAIAENRGYANVEFRLGEIENLPVEDGSVDVIVSNCVINLSVDKEKVFREAHRVLKPNGRILISDIVLEGELPAKIRKSLNAWSGCVAGALQKNAYISAIKKAGFRKVKVVSEIRWDYGILKMLEGKIASVKVEATKA